MNWDTYVNATPVFSFADTVLRDDVSQLADEDRIEGATLLQLLAFLAGARDANTQTLSADKTLVDTDAWVQFLDPDGGDHDVELPAEGEDNHPFFIVNNGSSGTLTPKNDAGTGIGSALSAGEAVEIKSDGTTWRALSGGGGSGGGIGTFEARLTLESFVPVSTTDQLAKTTLYLTPYKGDQVSLYSGSAWALHDLTEISIAIPATTNTPYDVFLYDNSGTLTLELVAWTDTANRATALATQDGVYVKTGDATRRYVGNILTTSVSGQCEKSTAFLYVWNYYNRVPIDLFKDDGTSHSYGTASYRYFNNDLSNEVRFFVGVVDDAISIFGNGTIDPSADGVSGILAASLNSNTGVVRRLNVRSDVAQAVKTGAAGENLPALGLNYVALLEYASAASVTFSSGFVSAVVKG
ncbi:MAG: hypothetical protein DWQ07_14205 [Chloroflexi bacterium]|nr:MAG: hypothetical protein DWQ07_14205 [Chloroflexota bacterium]MBL1195764.1 hypothetical protein [Chloroflexota bacterium]NOH13053.1 hypothetical protein [Chloroflexota bacterium]